MLSLSSTVTGPPVFTGGLIVSRPPELHVEILLGFLLSTIVSGPPTCILRKEFKFNSFRTSCITHGDIDAGIKFYSSAFSCILLCSIVNTEFGFLTDVASYRNINDSDSLGSWWWCPW